MCGGTNVPGGSVACHAKDASVTCFGRYVWPRISHTIPSTDRSAGRTSWISLRVMESCLLSVLGLEERHRPPAVLLHWLELVLLRELLVGRRVALDALLVEHRRRDVELLRDLPAVDGLAGRPAGDPAHEHHVLVHGRRELAALHALERLVGAAVRDDLRLEVALADGGRRERAGLVGHEHALQGRAELRLERLHDVRG